MKAAKDRPDQARYEERKKRRQELREEWLRTNELMEKYKTEDRENTQRLIEEQTQCRCAECTYRRGPTAREVRQLTQDEYDQRMTFLRQQAEQILAKGAV